MKKGGELEGRSGRATNPFHEASLEHDHWDNCGMMP